MDDDLVYQILPENFNYHFDLSFKIIILGASGVGKSSIAIKATQNEFYEKHRPTVGFEFHTLNIKINDINMKLQIWDTCGQELYHSLVRSFYHNCSLAILVYSIDNKRSFESVNYWLKDLKTQSNPNVKVFLVGNKSDREDNRVCSKEQGEQFASDNQFDFFIESSAKSDFNIQDIFIKAAQTLYKECNKYKSKLINKQIPALNPQIDIEVNAQKSTKGCC